jgi:hypothetical protein
MKALQSLKGNISLVVWLITIITGATGFSLIGGIDTFRSIANTPDEIVLLKQEFKSLESELHNLEHYQESAWELSRLMTDDLDTLSWFYIDSEGASHYIDIRNTAELVPLAFVFQENMIYQIYLSPADGRDYILVHDHEGGNSSKYYLYEKTEAP